jgi:RHS repeat-associated protein
LLYDGDGQRVAKTVNGVTTKYLVDTNNFTGYAQVVEELVNDEVQRQYSYGLDLISERQVIGNQATNNECEVSFYGYDGHGSVRYLSDLSGKVTDTYTYDAYGILLEQTGSTPNLYRYAGEQWDADLGLYYNRARYLDVERGRFWTSDSFEGEIEEPLSLHKYLYGNANPVGNVDPSGNATLVSQVLTQLGYLSTAYATVAFIQNPSIETASALALDLAIPGLGKGITTLGLAGKLSKYKEVIKSLKSAETFIPSIINEAETFDTLRKIGYKLIIPEKILSLLNYNKLNKKIIDGVFVNVNKRLSLIEVKETLTHNRIKDSLIKARDTIDVLDNVAKEGGKVESIHQLVDELIISYDKVGDLKKYSLGAEKVLDNGLIVRELELNNTKVFARIGKSSIPVYVRNNIK